MLFYRVGLSDYPSKCKITKLLSTAYLRACFSYSASKHQLTLSRTEMIPDICDVPEDGTSSMELSNFGDIQIFF